MSETNDQNRDAAAPELGEQLAQLTTEVRRQGRAAVAAQATAEACLEELGRLRELVAGASAQLAPAAPVSTASPPAASAAQSDREPRDSGQWLETLLPVFDAIDRAAAQAQRARDRVSGSGWRPWRSRAAATELLAVAEGLTMLREQLGSALAALDVMVDREVGCEVDPQRHRVIEIAPQSSLTARVVEVLRPGYALGDRQIRETEVCATRTGHSNSGAVQ